MMTHVGHWIRPGEGLHEVIAASLVSPREPDEKWFVLTNERLLYVGERQKIAHATFRSYPFDHIISIKMSRFGKLAKIEIRSDGRIDTVRAWRDLAAPFMSQIARRSDTTIL